MYIYIKITLLKCINILFIHISGWCRRHGGAGTQGAAQERGYQGKAKKTCALGMNRSVQRATICIRRMTIDTRKPNCATKSNGRTRERMRPSKQWRHQLPQTSCLPCVAGIPKSTARGRRQYNPGQRCQYGQPGLGATTHQPHSM